MGPGLLESAYERAMCVELEEAGTARSPARLSCRSCTKGTTIGEYRVDLLVEDMVVVEIKSVERFDPVFDAQVLTYLRVDRKARWAC